MMSAGRVFRQVGQGKQDIILTGERTLVSLYDGAKEKCRT